MSLTLVLTLVQDLALAGPLLRAAGEREVRLLVADRLAQEPRAKGALDALARGRDRADFQSTGEALVALGALSARGGLVIFPSESRSPHHAPSHALAASLPSRFVGATLQHGYECLGFLHNAAHEGERAAAGFAADIACGWLAPERLTAVPLADRPKLTATGSTLFLDPAPSAWLRAVLSDEPAPPLRGNGPVLVAENVQSVRLRGAPAAAFMEALAAVAKRRPVTLRPHPAGDFAKGRATPPAGVTLDTRPLAEADLAAYAAAISPPSTILFDLMRHDVPVAVWRDDAGRVDTRNYAGLPTVRGAADWLAFFEAPPSTEPQRAFLRRLGFPHDTRARFEALYRLGDDAASGDGVEHCL